MACNGGAASRLDMVTVVRGASSQDLIKVVREAGLPAELEQGVVSTVRIRPGMLGEDEGRDQGGSADQPHGDVHGEGDWAGGLAVDVLEQVHDFGPGGRIWDAALVLASYLVQRYGKSGMAGNAIELGAGTGMVGTITALMGAKTCVTDKEYVLPLMWANARLNANNAVERGELWAERIEWGQRLPKRLLRETWKHVLMSDCVGCGDEALFPPLLKSLKQLCHTHDTCITMAYKPRAGFERQFFEAAREAFLIRHVGRYTLPSASCMESYFAPVDVFEMRLRSQNATADEEAGEFLFDKAGYVFDDEYR